MKTKILVVQSYTNKYKHLNQDQRIYIAKRIKDWASFRQIANELGISHSTISREIKRNSLDKWRGEYIYDPKIAHQNYLSRRLQASAKRRLFIKFPHIFHKIKYLLINYKWSPIQISWRIKLELNINISPSTIYRRIRFFEPNLQVYLRHKHHPPKKWKKSSYRHKIKWKHISKISERKEIINKRERIWDFEIDTIVSSRRWRWWILTLVDRKSRYTIAIRLEKVNSKEVYEKLKKLKWKVVIKTITSDNWNEFVLAEEIVKELWIQRWYLCDPYSSWQRWTNERTNWLIRWFIPKWTDLSKITQKFLNEVIDKINLMPRKIHNYLTPYEVYFNTKLNLIP